MTTLLVLTITLLLFSSTSALASNTRPHTRRETLSGWTAAALATTGLVYHPFVSLAAEENTALSEDEMAARVARKKELLAQNKAGVKAPVAAGDIRSDVNPEASANLRSRSVLENAKIAVEKQSEMKSRNKMQKRDDLCEMLGRGC